MRIQHNITAMNSYRNFSANNSSLSKNLEKLSSGYKINRAGDDAAGLAISEKMRAQITGIEGATKNSKDGISLIQTAEGALTEVHDMLNRMTTLAEQSANGTYQDELDREQLQKEVESLKSEIDRIADSTNYNGLKLLDGSLGGAKEAQVSTLSGARVEQHVLDATSAVSTATLGALTIAPSKANNGESQATDAASKNAAATIEDMVGSKYTMNVGLSDGTSTAVSLTLKKEGSSYNLVGADDKVYGSFSAADFEAGTTAIDGDTPADRGYIDLAKANKNLSTKLGDAFVKAAKDTSLGDQFEMKAEWNTTGTAAEKVTFTTSDKGAAGITVTSVDLKMEAAKENLGVTDAAASGVVNKAGTDKAVGFDASKLVAYNASAYSGKGNANKAVFEVNGVKFAIGKYDQDLSALGEDVHYISLEEPADHPDHATEGGFDMVEMQNDGTEEVYDDGANNTKGFWVTDAGAKQIAHEISQKAGVEVTFQQLDGGTNGANKIMIDDGDTLKGTMNIFRVGDKAATEGKGLSLQIGDTSDSYNKLTVSVEDMHAAAIGVGDVDISTQEGASAALNKIKTAINMVSDTRGTLGALQNRLDHTINNLGVQRENIQNAESLIRDTDVAEEMMTYTKNNILNQSAQAMLAQANQLPQGVLQLLQ